MKSRVWGALTEVIGMTYLIVVFFSIDFPIFIIFAAFISLLGTAIFYQNNTTIVNGMLLSGSSIALLNLFQLLAIGYRRWVLSFVLYGLLDIPMSYHRQRHLPLSFLILSLHALSFSAPQYFLSL